MESLTRLVTESLARHGFDRPLDYRRLHWSRWFRCESHHSLLSVPSKPGVFAVAEEVMSLAATTTPVGADAPSASSEQADGRPAATTVQSGRDATAEASRMLAVTQFFEADDMAFVLDRMLTHQNPMRARLASGSYFVRYVVIEDQSQRRSICAALNQWIANSGEKVSGIGAHFATSLHLAPLTTHAEAADKPATPGSTDARVGTDVFVRPASEARTPGTGLAFSAPTSISTATHL